MPKDSKANDAPQPANYEMAMQELQNLVSSMESGNLPLEELLASYQRGAFLLSYCRNKLEVIDQQIQQLDQGMLKPWAEST